MRVVMHGQLAVAQDLSGPNRNDFEIANRWPLHRAALWQNEVGGENWF